MTLLIYAFPNLTFPPREGLHVQCIEQMKLMRTRGFDIGIVACVRNESAFDAGACIEHIGGVAFLETIRTRLNYPLLLVRNWLAPWVPSGTLIRLRHHLADLDANEVVVQLEGIPMTPLAAQFDGLPIVVNAIDAWSLRQDRLASQAKGISRVALRLYAYVAAATERAFYPRAAVVQVVSPADAAWLRNTMPGVAVSDIPLCVSSHALALPRKMRDETMPLKLAFWGDVSVAHLRDGLIWLEQKVLPRLRSSAISFELTVFGRHEPDEQLRLQLAEAHFVTWVDDVDSKLQACDVVLLPDQNGTGLKNRTLHAMALALPVVGTPQAFEGIPAAPSIEAWIETDPARFAEAIAMIAHDPNGSLRLGERGRAFVAARYSETAVANKWVELYDVALRASASARAIGTST